jgi:hypothetical protein
MDVLKDALNAFNAFLNESVVHVSGLVKVINHLMRRRI